MLRFVSQRAAFPPSGLMTIVATLVAELDQLRVRGWRDMVFIIDDNFIGNKIQAKALLQEIIAWRTLRQKTTSSQPDFGGRKQDFSH